jgi:hypothetical protein
MSGHAIENRRWMAPRGIYSIRERKDSARCDETHSFLFPLRIEFEFITINHQATFGFSHHLHLLGQEFDENVILLSFEVEHLSEHPHGIGAFPEVQEEFCQ